MRWIGTLSHWALAVLSEERRLHDRRGNVVEGRGMAGERVNLYKGIHPMKRIAFSAKVQLSFYKRALYTVTSVEYANQPAVGLALMLL